MINPSTSAIFQARKRLAEEGKPTGSDRKNIPIKPRDLLKALDDLSKRVARLEQELKSKRDY